MINFYDIAYAAGVVCSLPLWAVRSVSREKVLRALTQRMGHVIARDGHGPAVLIHAVSLGEINATRELVRQLQTAREDLHIIVTTTTVTGLVRARQLYGGKPGVTLARFPLDFSSAVRRLLDALDPSLIVLMEGEIWPNFLLQCNRRHIPVLLVNGRMTPSAFSRYQRIRFFASRMLHRITLICAQDAVYADRFKALGAPEERVRVTGTMKFDTASLAGSVEGASQLAGDLGLTSDPLWVAGSTGPGEETLILQAYEALLRQFPALRLAIIPRHDTRFDEVAETVIKAGFGLRRRSEQFTSPENSRAVILGDTMGELRKFYSLATVVFVGRSLVNLGSRQWGSDMIEPAALGKPVVIGPWTHNFAEAVRSFKSANAITEVDSVLKLTDTIAKWLNDPVSAEEKGNAAREVVRSNRGATERHVQMILDTLEK